MKRFLLICSALSILFFSCKKDQTANPTPPDNKTYPITFSLSGFEQTYVPIGKANTPGKKINDVDSIPVNKLYFLLLKDTSENGGIQSYKEVTKTTSGFGVFKEDVPAGQYTAIFIGSNGGIMDTKVKPALFSAFNYETFYSKIPVTISNAGVSQNVEMGRVTGQLVLNINDAVPAGVTKIEMTYTSATYFEVFTGLKKTFTPMTKTVALNATDAGKTNYRVIANLLASDNGVFSVTIKYYKTSQTTATGSVTIPNVQCKTNVRTILSGNLFTNDPPAGVGQNFTIKLDTTWNAPITTEF